MKKQVKQRDEQTKQNTNRNSDASANENRTPVSDETKQKLVKQYADRAEKESSKQNPVDWGYFNSPKFGGPVDERKQIANRAEASPSRSWGDNIGGTFSNDDRFKNGPEYGWPENKNIDVQYRPHGEALDLRGEASNTPFWNGASGGMGYQSSNYAPVESINMDQLNSIVNSMSNDAMADREDTNLRPNMLYGYGDAPLDVLSRYETPADRPEGYRTLYDYLEEEGLEDWANDSDVINGAPNQRDLATAFQLMQNANDYDRQQNLDRAIQQSRDRNLYGDALMELMAQRQTPQNNRSLLNEAIQQIRDQEILENRPSPRRRNITGSAVW